MKRFLSGIIAYLFTISMCLSIFCFVIESVSFDSDFLYETVDIEYVSGIIPIDEAQVQSTVNLIVDYIQGETGDMQVVLGDGSLLFNERELMHMADVQKLFALCDFMKFVCIGVCMVLFIVLFALNGFYSFRILARGCVKAMLSMLSLVIILAIWYFIDFSGFWTAFHKVAFTNDLWLMMPDDALIIFFTLDFFTAVVRRIIEKLAVIYGGLFIAALVGWMILPGEKVRKFDKKNTGH